MVTEDVPARTELTIDYDPKAAESEEHDVPQGARVCMCGADNCRGWVRV